MSITFFIADEPSTGLIITYPLPVTSIKCSCQRMFPQDRKFLFFFMMLIRFILMRMESKCRNNQAQLVATSIFYANTDVWKHCVSAWILCNQQTNKEWIWVVPRNVNCGQSIHIGHCDWERKWLMEVLSSKFFSKT